MRGGWVDAVQLIYNLFGQESAAELLPADLMVKLRRHNWRRAIWYPGNW